MTKRLVRGIVLAVLSITVGVGAAVAAPAKTEGVHGAAMVDVALGTDIGTWRFVINANRLPNGELAGTVIFTKSGFDTINDNALWAQPTFLQTTADTACVVAEVERLEGWLNPPLQIVLHIQDVPGGSDLVDVFFTLTPMDPLSLCATTSPPFPGFRQITQGNFTIL